MRFRIRNKITGYTTLAEWDSEYLNLITERFILPWNYYGEGEDALWEAVDDEALPAKAYEDKFKQFSDDPNWRRLEVQINYLLDQAQLLMNLQNQIIDNKIYK